MPKATLTEVQKRVFIKKDSSLGIQLFDEDNAYPQRVEDIISSSGTAALCTFMLRKFIFGGGFKDKNFYKQRVNKQGLTADKLLRKSARSLSRFNGVAFHVNYNALYQKTEVSIVPFKHIRFTTEDNKKYPNMLALYHDWGLDSERSVDVKKIDYINFYNPDPEQIQKEVDKAGGWANYKGQILFWSDEGLEYPLCPGDAVLEDMQTDSKIKYFKYRNVTTNFMASHVIEVDEFEGGEEGTGSKDKEAFMEMLQDFQGADESLKIMLLEKKAGASPATITKLDIQDVDKLYQYTEDSVKNNIIQQYGIPSVLILQVAGKLGNSTEIAEATEFYNSNTMDYRLICEECFTELFDNFAWDINPSKDYSIVPLKPAAVQKITQEYFPYVTKNEIRVSIGEPEVEEAEANVKSLVEQLGVGGTQAFIAMLTDPVLKEDQKLEIAINFFEIDEAKAKKMVYGKGTATV